MDDQQMLCKAISLFQNYDRRDLKRCQDITKEAKEILSPLAKEYGLRVKTSSGLGVQAVCPRFSFLGKKYTLNEGYRLEYLFDARCEYVYLTISSGTKNYRFEQIDKMKNYAKMKLNIVLEGEEEMTLYSSLPNPQKYMRSVILFRKYPLNHFTQFPIEEDFQEFLEIYRELLTKITDEEYRDLIKQVHEMYYDELLAHGMIGVNEKGNITCGASKISEKEWKEILKYRQELSQAGEQFVYQILKEEYPGASIRYIAKNSETAGYTFYVKGKQGVKYIQVKTTNGPIGETFLLSSHERHFAMKHPKEYMIYRIYSIRTEKGFYKISGQELLKNKMEPVSYRVIFK